MGKGCFAFFGYNHEKNTVLSHKNKQTRFNTNCRTCFFYGCRLNLFLIWEIVLDKRKIVLYLHPLSGCSVARLSRLLWEQEAAGSNPATPTKTFL